MSYQEGGDSRRKRWSEWPRGAKIAVMVAAAVVLIPVFLAFCGAITMWLWNWLMPAIFKLPTIGFWQAVGILILSHILFGGRRFRNAGRRHWKKERMRHEMGEAAPQPKAE
jgi:apolipoprotein N-acyltransferase